MEKSIKNAQCSESSKFQILTDLEVSQKDTKKGSNSDTNQSSTQGNQSKLLDLPELKATNKTNSSRCVNTGTQVARNDEL